jgi:hypothetical protein
MSITAIPAKEIDGELWVKASDCQQAIRQATEQAQEPVAYMDGYGNLYSLEEIARGCLEADIPLYATPQPQRTWVGMTEEDLKLLSAEWRIVYGAWMDDFARDIEAKLKEKNT